MRGKIDPQFVSQLSDTLAAVTEQRDMERGLRQLAEQRLAEEKAKSNFLEQRVNEFESAQNLQAASNKINATSSPAAGGLFTRAKTINESGPETPTPDSHAAPAA